MTNKGAGGSGGAEVHSGWSLAHRAEVTKWLAYQKPIGGYTPIRLGAPNNGPCVPMRVVGRGGGNQQNAADRRGRDP